VEDSRKESEQAARAMAEQSRALKDLTTGAQNISKQIGLITRANREHSTVSVAILGALKEIRSVTEQNVAGVKDTLRNTGSLLERVQSLNTAMDGLQAANGRGGKRSKTKKKK